jgi:hypothetical protein
MLLLLGRVLLLPGAAAVEEAGARPPLGRRHDIARQAGLVDGVIGCPRTSAPAVRRLTSVAQCRGDQQQLPKPYRVVAGLLDRGLQS